MCESGVKSINRREDDEKKIIIWNRITWPCSSMMSCEDLEDTYDEWSGDGMVRYVGKAGDVEVAPVGNACA